ncbi:MAG: fumarate hydratase C-terminal domain-containing protein [Pirellulales bacterium]
MTRQLELPISTEQIESLRVGAEVELSGLVLTGRDQACARLCTLLRDKLPLPVDPAGELIYFVGPSPAPPGRVIGSAGPTTSGRMDRYIPTLLAAGFRGFIGKGYLSAQSKAAFVRDRGVYFGAIGGAGALLSRSITEVKVVAFCELLSEAMHRMRFKRFPVVVLHDCHGGDLYADVRKGAATTP